LHATAGEEFTAKDFRTWAGTVLAVRALQECAIGESVTQARRNVVRAIEAVAKQLGNTRAVCRKCYIHPVVLEAYLGGTLGAAIQQPVDLPGLSPEEANVLALIRKRS